MPSIILSDNGVSSGSAGLKQTAGNDGVLILQTTTSGGTATNAVYVDTSQRVGIGQSTPAYLLDVNGTMRLGSAGSIQPLLLRSSVTGGLLVNNTASGGAGPLIVQDNGTEVLRVTDSLVVLKGGNTAATGTGITFPATQSASTDANTLDDYEEGTWTPVFQSDVAGTGRATTVSFANYVKVGRSVTVEFAAQITTLGSGGSGVWVINGLPFASSNGAALCVAEATNLNSTVYVLGGITNGSRFVVRYMNTLTSTYLSNANFSTFVTTNTYVSGSCTYQVA